MDGPAAFAFEWLDPGVTRLTGEVGIPEVVVPCVWSKYEVEDVPPPGDTMPGETFE